MPTVQQKEASVFQMTMKTAMTLKGLTTGMSRALLQNSQSHRAINFRCQISVKLKRWVGGTRWQVRKRAIMSEQWQHHKSVSSTRNQYQRIIDLIFLTNHLRPCKTMKLHLIVQIMALRADQLILRLKQRCPGLCKPKVRIKSQSNLAWKIEQKFSRSHLLLKNLPKNNKQRDLNHPIRRHKILSKFWSKMFKDSIYLRCLVQKGIPFLKDHRQPRRNQNLKGKTRMNQL